MPELQNKIYLDSDKSASFGVAKMLKFLCVSLAIFASSNVALAETKLSGTYAGGGYSSSDQSFKLTGNPTFKRSRGHLKLKYGMNLNEYLDAEGQLGATSDIGSDEGIVTYGAYLRFFKDFEDRSYRAYGMLGVSGTEDFNDVTKLSESGLSYGFGFEIFGSKNIAIGIEVLRLYETSFQGGDLSTDTLSLGVTYYFTEETSVFDRNRDKIKSIRY